MRKILFLISEDWFFASHFLSMARAARAAGFEVAVATRVKKHRARIEAEGARVISLDLDRGTVAPFAGTGREGLLDGSNAEAWFAQSSGLTILDGHLYVADSGQPSLAC